MGGRRSSLLFFPHKVKKCCVVTPLFLSDETPDPRSLVSLHTPRQCVLQKERNSQPTLTQSQNSQCPVSCLIVLSREDACFPEEQSFQSDLQEEGNLWMKGQMLGRLQKVNGPHVTQVIIHCCQHCSSNIRPRSQALFISQDSLLYSIYQAESFAVF